MLWKYVRAVFKNAAHGFELKADSFYVLVSAGLGLLTGPRRTPVHELTPEQIGWYVLVPLLIYAAFRLFVLAPYKTWKVELATIDSLQTALGRPERLGSDEFQRLKAGKRLELSEEVRLFHWDCYSKSVEASDDKAQERYRKIIRLVGQVNPHWSFWRVFSKLHALAVEIRDETIEARDTPEGEARRNDSMTYAQALQDYLHGELSEAELTKLGGEQ